MEFRWSKGTVVALALVALTLPSTFSAPSTRSMSATCSPAVCRKSEGSKLNYQEGKSYIYNFETEVNTQVVGTSDDVSKIKVKGQAVIAVQSQCDFLLTLNQVGIQNPSGQSISRVDDVEGSTIRFSYQDGEIESICVSEDDKVWSVNLKRAVISMLTNRAHKAEGDVATIETDISGRCPTTYEISGDKYVKTRDLNACSDRDGGSSIIFGVPYKAQSRYNSMSVIDSILTCTQEVSNGVFERVSCTEIHKVPILSTSTSGVSTEIKSTLNLVSTQDGVQRGSKSATKPASVVYDHAPQKSSSTKVLDYVNKICQEIESGVVTSKVPSLYLQLIKAMKTEEKEGVKQAYEKVKSGELCSKSSEKLLKLVIDAAATSGGDGSIAFVADLISKDEAGCHTKALFHSHASFSSSPNTNALESMKNLISKSEVDSEYLLTASAVAHQYCKVTNAKCSSNNEYQSLVDKIADQVKSVNDDAEMKKVVTALQALGNLDHLSNKAVSAIKNLLTDKSTGERLKVHALDAYRSDPCQQQLKQEAFKIFSDIKQSSHVRIQAYLTISKCIQQSDVTTLQNALNKEESNQVGSFVASHIENVLESASPSKQEVKQIFSQFNIPEALRRDVRKVSRNSEFSTFFPNLNVGASAEGNLIFSQDSYLPRMTSANLTLDAFGRSYNFLEVGVYAEQFEHIIEKWFGPTGKLRKSNLEKLWIEGSEKLSKMVENVRKRFRRGVNVEVNDNEIDALTSQIDLEERTGDNGVGDVYIRVLGITVMAESFLEAQLRKGSLSNNIKKGIEKLMEGVNEHKFDITYPIVFLDEELSLPTFSGLPLNLEVQGSSIMSLQMNGNLDVMSLFRGDSSDMRAKIIPSAATVIKSKMTVGTGPFVESGLQLEGKIHSSAGVDLKLVKENDKFEFRFNLPQERTQIIDMRSDLYWVEQPQNSLEKKTPVQSKLTTKSLIDNDCTTTFSKITGLKICADMKIPTVSRSAPIPLLNGPTVVSLSIEKSEPSMEGYYLKIEKNTQSKDNLEIEFLLDTPGSRTNRKVLASMKAMQYKSSTPEYSLKLDSPWTKLDVDYKRSFNDALKGFDLKVVSDGETFSGKLQLKKVKAGGVNKYEPIAHYTLPGGKPVKLIEGHVVRVEGDGKLEIDLRTAGPIKSLRGSVKGTIEMSQKDGFEVKAKDLEFSSDMAGKVILDGHVKKVEKMLKTKILAKYGQNAQHSLEFESKIGQPKPQHFEFKTKTRSSRNQFLNFDIDAQISKSGHSYKSEMEYTRGVEEPKVHISHKLHTTIESKKKFEIFHETIVKQPYMNLDMYSKIDAKTSPGEPRHAELIFNVNSFKSNAKYESSGQNFLDYDVKAKAQYAEKTYEFTEVSTKASEHKQNFKTKLSVTPGFWYAGDTDVMYKFEKSDIESLISTTITSDKFTEPIVFKSGVKGKPEGYSALMKLDMKGNNYLDLATHFKHSKGSSKPATLTMKAIVRNYLDAKMSQTLSRSKSDMQLDIKWVPTGRKIESKSTLSVTGDVFDLDANLKWDADRDASKSASIKSVTSLSFSNIQFDSKNDIAISGKLSKLNLKGKGMKEFLNGEDNLEIEYTTPNGKTYKLSTVLNLENKLRSKGGKINIKFTLPGETPYEFTYEKRISNINSQEMTFEAFTDIKFDYKGEKDVKFRAELGSLLPGNYRTYTGKINIGGSVFAQPISANLNVDMKKGRFAMKGASERGTRKGDIDLSVDYDIWSPKRTLDVKYTINTPFDHFGNVEAVHKLGWLFNSWKNFEYTEEGSFSMNHGSPMQWKYITSVLENEFKYLSEFTNEGESVYQVIADGKLTSKKLITDIQATYRGDKSFLKFDVDHKLPNFAIDLKGGSPQTSFEFKTTHQMLSEGVFETDVLAKVKDELAFRVTNKLEVSPQKKSIDLMIAAAEEPARRVYLLLDKVSGDKYNVEALLRWGDGSKYINSKGELTRSSEGFDALLTFDSPELKTNKMNLKLSKKLQDGRHALNLKVQESNKDKFLAAIDFSSKEERSQTVHEGSILVKGDKSLVDIDFNGKFRLEDVKLARQRGDDEDGRQFKGTFEVGKSGTPVKGSAVLKTSDKEKRVQLSVCNEDKGKCNSGDVHFRHKHENNGDIEYSLRIVGESDESGQKTVKGVSLLTTKRENGRQMDHIVKLILNSRNSEQVGYRLYRKNGHEFGAEILLPERIIATVLDCQHPGPSDVQLDLSFYIDKIRQPTRKISLIFNTERSKTTNGRMIDFTFKHPDIPKDLKVSSQYTFGGDAAKILEVKTTLDIFKENSEIVMAYKAEMENQNLYKTLWSITSKGQSINFGGNSEISAVGGKFSYKHELHYENRDKQIKTMKLETLMSMNKMSFEVNGPSEKLVSLISVIEENPTGYEYRTEVLLPGMEDTRIFQALLTTVSPRKAQLKTFTSDSPNGVFYEAIIGFKTQNQFVAGIYDHEASGTKVLADVNVGLNNSRILFVKSNWEVQNVKNVFTKAQARAERNGKNLKTLIESFKEDVMKEIQFTVTNLRKSSPALKPAFNSARTQLADLAVELDAHEDTKLLVDQFSVVQGYFKKFAKILYEMTKVARRLLITLTYAVRENLEQLPELLQDYANKLPYTLEDVNEWVDTVMFNLIDLFRKSVKMWKQTVDNISNNMPEIINKINYVLDLTAGMQDCIREFVETVLDRAANCWKSIRRYTKEIIDNDLVRLFIKDTLAVVQMMISEFIEETKNHAESLKNYLLEAIPEQEFQQLIQLTADYVEKKAKNEVVDDAAAVKEICDKFVQLVKKVSARFFTIETEDGYFLATIPLPSPVDSLSDLTNIFKRMTIPSPPSLKYNLPSYRFGFSEVFNKIRHGADLHEFVPPYDAYALLIGSQYYKTFDGKFFKFDGSCQYLLASDIEDKNFTVVADFERNGADVQKAIIVKDSHTTIAIKADSVVINGRNVPIRDLTEAPQTANHFKVEHVHDWVVITGEKGFKVGCSSTYDVCAMRVSGYYHGKTMGLFGKFNGEKYDEMTSPSGKIANNVNDFVKSWTVDQCQEQTVISLPAISSEASQACSDAFESKSSSLRPCFGVVEANDYKRMCENMSSTYNTVSKAVCTASTGYQKACKLSYVKVDNLQECRSL